MLRWVLLGAVVVIGLSRAAGQEPDDGRKNWKYAEGASRNTDGKKWVETHVNGVKFNWTETGRTPLKVTLSDSVRKLTIDLGDKSATVYVGMTKKTYAGGWDEASPAGVAKQPAKNPGVVPPVGKPADKVAGKPIADPPVQGGFKETDGFRVDKSLLQSSALAPCPDGSKVLFHRTKQRVGELDTCSLDGKPIGRKQTYDVLVDNIAWSGDGSVVAVTNVASATKTESIYTVNLFDKDLKRIWTPYRGASPLSQPTIPAVALSTDGKVAAVSTLKGVNVYDVSEQKEIYSKPVDGQAAVALSGDGKTFAYFQFGNVGSKPALLAVDLSSGKERVRLSQYRNVQSHELLVTSDGGKLIVADLNDGVFVHDSNDRGKVLRRLSFPVGFRMSAMALMDQDRHLVVGGVRNSGEDGFIVYNLESGEALQTLATSKVDRTAGLRGGLKCWASADSSRLFTLTGDSRFRVWTTPFGNGAAK